MAGLLSSMKFGSSGFAGIAFRTPLGLGSCSSKAARLGFLLVLVVSGCQKTNFAEVPRLPVDIAAPTAPPAAPVPSPTAVPVAQLADPPPPQLKLNVLRFENESWYKTCFWMTVDGKFSDATALGCNKGAPLLGQTSQVNIPDQDAGKVSTPGCRMLGIRAEVFKNTENCTDEQACAPESYSSEATYVRTTSQQERPTAFIVQVQGQNAGVDSRVSFNGSFLKDHLEWSRQPTVQFVQQIRVFFEDQSAEVLQAAFGPGGSPSDSGVDYNDVIFDISLTASQSLGFESTPLACAGSYPPP